jgi:LuxR family maltose regulon positive regulatory protein
LPRLRARGQLNEVRAADLRFDAEEASSLLQTSLGQRLPGEQVAAVVDRTEGWAAGLQLAGLALRDRQDPAAFIASFAGSHRLVADYLTAEVLDRQAPATRRFLLTTSVVDRLCAPVCDALLAADGAAGDGADAVSDSQSMLEEFERANLFLVPLDEERRWYRYHQLFADALRAQLGRQAGREAVAALHRRASAWFASQGLQAEAVQHALAAGDGVLAARLIEPLARQMQVRGENITLLGWLGKLPEDELRARPDLGVIYAWVLAISGQVRTAERWLNSLEPSLAASADAERLQAESIVIRARIALTSGQYARAVELARRALGALAEHDAALRALTHTTLAFGSMVLDDLTTAGQGFADASELYQAIGHASQAQLPLRHLAKVQMARGQLHALGRTSQAALRIATDSAQRSRLAGYTYLSLAELAYERNDLATAERSFTEGLALVQLGGHSEVVNLIYLVDAHLGLAKLRQVRGDGQAALELTHQVEPLVRQMARTIEEREQSGPVRTRPWLISMQVDLIATCQVWLWLMQGNVDAARDVALEQQWDLDAEVTLFQDRGPGLVAMARLLIAQAEYARALGVLERLLAAAQASGRVGRVIEILALQALALQAQKDESAAVRALEAALALAEPEGYVRTFVDEGQGMASLLRKALARGIARGYVEDLVAAFGTRDTARRDQPVVTAGLEPVTPRELQVLRLLADGASNAELARALVVEQSTVKTHLIHLYSKLDAHNRTQAVARARALQLLD